MNMNFKVIKTFVVDYENYIDVVFKDMNYMVQHMTKVSEPNNFDLKEQAYGEDVTALNIMKDKEVKKDGTIGPKG